MTSTATKTRSPGRPKSTLAELDRLEEKVATAGAEARRLSHQHYAAQQHARELQERKRARQHSAPAEYTADLNPRKGTEAEAIEEEIGRVGTIDLSEEINRAEQLRRLAETEVGAYRFAHAEALARAFAERGEAMAQAANETLTLAAQTVRDYEDHRGRFEAFVGSLPGAINGRDVHADGRVGEILKALQSLVEHEISGPYSGSLTVRNELERRYVLGPEKDGYIKVANVR